MISTRNIKPVGIEITAAMNADDTENTSVKDLMNKFVTSQTGA